jgi:hypothetical protein
MNHMEDDASMNGVPMETSYIPEVTSRRPELKNRTFARGGHVVVAVASSKNELEDEECKKFENYKIIILTCFSAILYYIHN